MNLRIELHKLTGTYDVCLYIDGELQEFWSDNWTRSEAEKALQLIVNGFDPIPSDEFSL